MFINAKEFNDLSKQLRVYNTHPHIVRAMDVYFITDDAALSAAILTPINGGPRIKIVIDGEEYPLEYGSPGEGPNNPIIYKKALSNSKVKFKDTDPYREQKVTGIVGTSDILAGEWIVGTNINELDDSVVINLIVIDLPEIAVTDGKNGILVVDVSQSMKYNYLYRTETVSLVGFAESMGYGQSSYGGLLDGGVESFGGVAILS